MEKINLDQFKVMDKIERAELVNSCIQNGTDGVKEKFDISWTTIAKVLEEDGFYYSASAKKIIMDSPFSLKEIIKIKALIGTEEVEKTTERDIQHRITNMNLSGVLKGESRNRSFNIDIDLYTQMMEYINKINPKNNIKMKDIFNLMILDFINNNPV